MCYSCTCFVNKSYYLHYQPHYSSSTSIGNSGHVGRQVHFAASWLVSLQRRIQSTSTCPTMTRKMLSTPKVPVSLAAQQDGFQSGRSICGWRARRVYGKSVRRVCASTYKLVKDDGSSCIFHRLSIYYYSNTVYFVSDNWHSIHSTPKSFAIEFILALWSVVQQYPV